MDIDKREDEVVAGKGRPAVEDKRTNQYRVLMNDKEDRMLDYCSKATGLPKSQIFRKGIEVLYQQVRLNEYGKDYGQDYDGHISLRRVVNCPYCGAGNAIDFEAYITDEYCYERQMGSEIEHAFLCENYECMSCRQRFTAEGSIHEYPIGAYDSEHIEICK